MLLISLKLTLFHNYILITFYDKFYFLNTLVRELSLGKMVHGSESLKTTALGNASVAEMSKKFLPGGLNPSSQYSPAR